MPKPLALLVASLCLAGCATAPAVPELSAELNPTTDTPSLEVLSDDSNNSPWQNLRQHMQLVSMDNPRIQAERSELTHNPRHLQRLSEQANPYLPYVLEQMSDRGLPAELAMIPMIESGYRPDAVSPGRNAGLWQLSSDTARNLGLRVSQGYDGRKSVADSTDAALDYLQRLHEMFDGDWLLAIAAYNSGEGTVMRAIARNRQAGKSTDFWNLPLPSHTREYVPKVIALSQILSSPNDYGVDLPTLDDAPYLVPVELEGSVDMKAAARIVGLSEQELLAYNPALRKSNGLARAQVMVPNHSADALRAQAKQLPKVAEQFVASVDVEQAPSATSSSPKKTASKAANRRYTVRKGDTLGSIAQRHGVSSRELAQWNKLNGQSNLRPGQSLVVSR